ncbi:MAG: hypothetical protein KKH85_02830 [Proteobacteria bacterium]|nr:hypothetical protein [Pseudomonadota bacterium]
MNSGKEGAKAQRRSAILIGGPSGIEGVAMKLCVSLVFLLNGDWFLVHGFWLKRLNRKGAQG